MPNWNHGSFPYQLPRIPDRRIGAHVEPAQRTRLALWTSTEAYTLQPWLIQVLFSPPSMRRSRASDGLRHSCTGGAWFSCCLHHIIPTKSTTRVELEQQTYADSNAVHEPGANYPERISGLQALVEEPPPLPSAECKLLWHCTLEKFLDGTRDGSNQILGDWDRGVTTIPELNIRIEELGRLKDQMRAVGTSIAKTVSDGTLTI